MSDSASNKYFLLALVIGSIFLFMIAPEGQS